MNFMKNLVYLGELGDNGAFLIEYWDILLDWILDVSDSLLLYSGNSAFLDVPNFSRDESLSEPGYYAFWLKIEDKSFARRFFKAPVFDVDWKICGMYAYCNNVLLGSLEVSDEENFFVIEGVLDLSIQSTFEEIIMDSQILERASSWLSDLGEGLIFLRPK
ncbi:MAG: hypothetical protein RLY93_03180 [Sumerlaeia bacterium]